MKEFTNINSKTQSLNVPIELYATDSKYYAFDIKNVCFFELDKSAFKVLNIIRERNASINELAILIPDISKSKIQTILDDIQELQTSGYLQAYKFRRTVKHSDSTIRKVLSGSMTGFTVFVTTQCNLGCSYCLYGGQYDQHEMLNSKIMSWEVLKLTIDFIVKHSKESKLIRLDFFGGEPLLGFNLIQKGTLYIESILEKYPSRDVNITITSNGTILSDRILKFIIEHNIYIQFSLDGGKTRHDENRIFKRTNRGSHSAIMTNLERIYSSSPEYYKNNVRLKAVVTGLDSREDDIEFFDDPLIRTIIKQGHFHFINIEPHYDIRKDETFFRNLNYLGNKLLELKGLKTNADILKALNPYEQAMYQDTFMNFFDIQAVHAVHNLDNCMPFTKGCLPGYQQASVKPNGDITICLKASNGEKFVIGNVIDGNWNFDRLSSLNRSLHLEWDECTTCFLQNCCDLCYEKLNGSDMEWTISRRKFCDFNRAKYSLIFSYMLLLMQNNSLLWQYLDDLITNKLDRRDLAQ